MPECCLPPRRNIKRPGEGPRRGSCSCSRKKSLEYTIYFLQKDPFLSHENTRSSTANSYINWGARILGSENPWERVQSWFSFSLPCSAWLTKKRYDLSIFSNRRKECAVAVVVQVVATDWVMRIKQLAVFSSVKQSKGTFVKEKY